MQAHEVMVTPVYKVKEGDAVRAVIEKMIKHRISGLPIVNDRNEVVAYVSDGDIMRYIGKHKDLIIDSIYFVHVIKGDADEYEDRVERVLRLPVMEIATKKVIKVSWEEELENIAAILGQKKIKQVPVERNGVLVGLISRGDVIRHSFKSLI